MSVRPLPRKLSICVAAALLALPAVAPYAQVHRHDHGPTAPQASAAPHADHGHRSSYHDPAAIPFPTLAATLTSSSPYLLPVVGRSLPSLGDEGDISVSDERRLGDRIARSIYRDPQYLDDPQLTDYLQALWKPLMAAAKVRGDVSPDLAERFAWELMVSSDRSVNAFALPGGYLGVHLGLIATVSNPSELASVLAHELSHVSQRHIARLVGQQGRQTPWVIAAMVLGALAASAARNADIAGAAIAGGQALAVQSQLNFARDLAREADRVGFGIMTDAGFDGVGFVTMFDKLQQASRLNDDGSFPYLRSHPLSSERMADMRARVPLDDAELRQRSAQGAAGRQALVSDEWHAMMAARARVLSETGVDRLRALALQGRQSNGPQRAQNDTATLSTRYAAALAATQLRDASLAEQSLRALWASGLSAPDAQAAARWLTLEAMTAVPALRSTDLGGGWNALQQAALASGTRAGLLVGARAALASGPEPVRAASERLRSWTALQSTDALAWQTLSSLYQTQNLPARAARADAEARLAYRDAPGALDRFRAAQSMARQDPSADHFELSILDARVRQVEQQVREEERERRESGG